MVMLTQCQWFGTTKTDLTKEMMMKQKETTMTKRHLRRMVEGKPYLNVPQMHRGRSRFYDVEHVVTGKSISVRCSGKYGRTSVAEAEERITSLEIPLGRVLTYYIRREKDALIAMFKAKDKLKDSLMSDKPGWLSRTSELALPVTRNANKAFYAKKNQGKIRMMMDKELGEEVDPTPWCHACGAMEQENCDCLPIAENN